MKMSKEFIDEMTERVVNHNMPPGDMLDAIKERIQSDGNYVDLAKELSEVKGKLDEQMKLLSKLDDVAEQLDKLAKLKDSGVISEEELVMVQQLSLLQWLRAVSSFGSCIFLYT